MKKSEMMKLKLRINPKPIAMVEMNSDKFRQNLSKFPGLRKPLENSMVIRHIDDELVRQAKSHNEDANKFIRGLTYFNINWRPFLEFMGDDEIVVPNIIKFNFHEVECDGKPQYKIGRINGELSEGSIGLGDIELKLNHIYKDWIMISNFPIAYESQLEIWLAKDILLYGSGSDNDDEA